MMSAKNLFIAATILLLQGCSSLIGVTPTPGPAQRVVYQDGGVYLLSEKLHSAIVGVERTAFDSSQGLFVVVSIRPSGVTPVNFSSENIRATIDGKEAKVLSYDELLANAERERNRRSFGVKLQQLANSMGTSNAGTSTSTYQGTTQGYVQGRNGPILIQGQTTGTITTYDPAAAAQAQAQFQENMRRQAEDINTDFTNQVASFGNALRPQTVQVGKIGVGVVQIEGAMPTGSKSTLRIEVDVAGEIHAFRLNLIAKN